MNAFIELQLKTGSIIALSVLIYSLFLSRDSFFQRNRGWLLATVIVPWIVPLMAMPTWLKGLLIKPETKTEALVLTMDVPANNMIAEPTPDPVNWLLIALSLYTVVSLILTIRIVWGYVFIQHLKKKGQAKEFKGFKVVLLKDNDVNPFSFYRTIYMPKHLEKDKNRQMILEHERTHCAQLHSIDISLAEWLLIIQWWNPFVWWLRKLIAQNHEYCVDNAMIQITEEPKVYQYSLLNLLNTNRRMQLVNNFNQSLTKKRLVMMNKKHTNRLIGWSKNLLLIPLMSLALLAFTNPNKVQDKTKIEKVSSEKELRKFIAQNIKYPGIARDMGVWSDVVAQFSISADGDLKQLKAKDHVNNATELDGVVVVAYGEPVTKMPSSKSSSKKQIQKYFEDEVATVLDKMPSVIDKELVGKTLQLDVKFVLQGSKEQQVKPVKATETSLNIMIKDEGRSELSPVKPSLILVDGKSYDGDINDISPDDIYSINVIKGEAAIEKFGNEAKDGVVEITTKKAHTNACERRVVVGKPLTIDVAEKAFAGKEPLYVVDGIKKKSIDIDPKYINTVTVLKGEKASRLYGADPEKGVIIITTKPVSDEESDVNGSQTNKVSNEVKPDEVVVVGYGKMEKSGMGDMLTRMGNQAEPILVNRSSGEGDPYIMIDGVEYIGEIADINPDDIESISVLKEESATELYGDKAKNGVILINSKK